MMHTNKKGMSKLLKKCTLPITGRKCVKKIVTNLAVIEITENGFQLKEKANDVSVNEIIEATEGKLIIPKEVPNIAL